MIRLAVPSIDEDDLEAVRETLASGLLVQGAHVEEFEQLVAGYVGTKHAIAVSSCTAALHLALLALGVGPGDRVAVPTYSWPATANVVALCGAEPVFVEIEPEMFNMSPAALEETLQRTKVKAVVPVHAFGGIAEMPRLMETAARNGAKIVEDAACALGAAMDHRNAGTWGVMGCFSFHPRKAITTGEGGMITTDDPALARTLRALRNHGQDPTAAAPDFVLPGYNLRLTEFQAALGVTQMKKVDRIIACRRAGAVNYDGLLRDTEVKPPSALAGSHHVYQSYVIQLPLNAASRRAEIIGALKAHGVETTIGTYHLPLTTYFREKGGHAVGDFPVTDDVNQRSMSLPLFEGLTNEQQEKVVELLIQCTDAGDVSSVTQNQL